MKPSNQHGGYRSNSGRKQCEETTVIRVPIALLKHVNDMVTQHKAKKRNKQTVFDCDCKILGTTANGMPIISKCIKHR